MAAGYKDFTAGATLAAADLEDYCELQGAMRFATSAARDTALSAVKTAGMLAVTLDFGQRLWMYNGTSWDLLKYSATTGRPGVVLTDAAQTLTSGTPTDITWGTEVSDVDGWTSGGSATLTVPTGWDGRYAISYTAVANLALAGNCSAALSLTGAVIAGVPADFVQNAFAFSTVRTLAAADTLKVTVTQTSAANRDFVSRLEIAWLGR